MEIEEGASFSLLSSNKTSDSRLQVQLHPLVILTISDYVTRHTLRQQEGSIVGAIIGAQNGRDITMEHAFECNLEESSNGETLINAGWFSDRLQQYRDVHKSPALDLVAWFTLAPPSGPQPHHLPIHNQLLQNYNDSILLLTLHPSSVADSSSRGGRLPLTIYETVYETEGSSSHDDQQMQASGEGAPQLALRFMELPFNIETGEAEMIGVDFVARGGANSATLKQESAKQSKSGETAEAAAFAPKSKGISKDPKAPIDAKTSSAASKSQVRDTLSPEDEELIASLTAKANAVRMLQQRLTLIQSYLQSLPPCYLNTPPASSTSNSSHSSTPSASIEAHSQISHPVLRSISAMLSRLALLPPTMSRSSPENGEITAAQLGTVAHLGPVNEAQAFRTDVALTSLLGSMGTTLRSAHEMGRKAGIVEQARATAAMKAMTGSPGGPGAPGGGGPGGVRRAAQGPGFLRSRVAGMFFTDADGNDINPEDMPADLASGSGSGGGGGSRARRR